MRHSPAVVLTTALALPLTLALPAWAHEGEDHGAPAAPAPSGGAGDRAVAATADFELVAVLAEGGLALYLDRFATNEPVTDAQVEVESGAFSAVAAQAAPGLYRVPAGPFGHPGKYPLVISVQAGDIADLLTATIEVAQPAAVSGQAQPWDAWGDARALGAVAGALLLAGAGIVAVRHKRGTRGEA
jgi:hypothetical protein